MAVLYSPPLHSLIMVQDSYHTTCGGPCLHQTTMLALRDSVVQAIPRQQPSLQNDVCTLINSFAGPSAMNTPHLTHAASNSRVRGQLLVPSLLSESTSLPAKSPSVARSYRLQGGKLSAHHKLSSASTNTEALPHHETLSERIGRRAVRLGLSPEQEVACCQILQVGLNGLRVNSVEPDRTYLSGITECSASGPHAGHPIAKQITL